MFRMHYELFDKSKTKIQKAKIPKNWFCIVKDMEPDIL